ncbi:MAG: AAA family ATPase [Anaerolineales bacterium]|nr:AAA family ATPase [Anaerolineales bacterium]
MNQKNMLALALSTKEDEQLEVDLEWRVAQRRVDRFRQKFGPSYFRLACYAAVPLILTPDLVHALRMNFFRGSDHLPWIAEADLLLSDLCHEIIGESYQMDVPVREVLLAAVEQEAPPERLKEIAQLALSYLNEMTSSDFGPQLRNAQEVAMWSFIEPNEAGQWLVERFQNTLTPAREAQPKEELAAEPMAVTSLLPSVNLTEAAHLTRLAETIHRQIGSDSVLVKYARALSSLIYGRISQAEVRFQNNFGTVSKPVVVNENTTLPSFNQLIGRSEAKTGLESPALDRYDDFSPHLFVDRDVELDALIQWATADQVPRRLRTITSPPGYGKSWLLHQLEYSLAKIRHKRDLFLIRVPTLKLKSRQDIADWLLSLFIEAQKFRAEIRNYDPVNSLEVIIARFLEDVCQNCSPPLYPLLLVDEFDKLLDNERRELEKRLLEQFWMNPCVRIVMAFRDDLGLKSPNLRRGEQRISLQVFTPKVGQKQLIKLVAGHHNLALKPEDLLPIIPPYNWTHPAINAYLFALAQQEASQRQPFAFTAADLRNCWILLIKEKLTQEFIELSTIETDLKAIVAGEDTWTLETFATACDYSQGKALDHLQNLMALSIVTQAGGQRYRVVDGLRELLRAEERLTEKGKKRIVSSLLWPFLPEEQRTPEQNERWWAECYVPSPADVTLRGLPRSVIVSGGPGSGKTTALQALEKQEIGGWLIFRYPVERWPGKPYAWASGHQHLGQMMACASITIKDFLTRHPEKANALSYTNLEFLRWLIEKYSNARAFRRWADDLNQPALLELLQQPFDDIYPTETALADVQGQIEELVTVSRRLGFAGVMVLVDIDEAEAAQKAVLEQISDLFGWLTPLQIEGFAIKAAIPEQAVKQARLIDRSRGRITFARLDWSIKLCREIGQRHLSAATEGKLTTLRQLANESVLARLEEQLTALYLGPSPQAWVCLTAVLLDHYTKSGQRLVVDSEALIRDYFVHFVPLKIDRERLGVWRGTQFMSLEPQTFRFLEILWHHRQGSDATRDLLAISGSKGNVNSLASRLRKRIEPVPSQPVYIHNSRNQGYWLENVVEV